MRWDPYWGGRYSYSVGVGTTTPTTYRSGTLIIDIWDAREGKLVWRGTAEGSSNPEKAVKKIETGIKKIASKWRRSYRRLPLEATVLAEKKRAPPTREGPLNRPKRSSIRT